MDPATDLGLIAAVVAALLALLFLYGVQNLIKGLAALFPKDIPYIGSFIHNTLLAAGAAAGAALQWLMASVIRPVIQFVLGPVLAMLNYLASLALFVRSMSGSWAWLIGSEIPHVISRLLAKIATVAANVRAYALHLVRDLRADVHNLIDAARAYAARIAAAALATALDRIHGLRADVRDWIDAARSFAAKEAAAALATAKTLIHTVRVDLTKAVATAEAAAVAGDRALTDLVTSTAASTLGTAERYTDDAIAAVGAGILAVDLPGVPDLVDGLIDDVGGLVGVLGTDLPQLGDLLKDLDLTVPLDIAGALTSGLVLERVLARYLRDCGVPNCRNLSGLGRFLEDLLGAVGLAALLAMLAEMISDPQSAAHATVDDLSGVLDGATGLARDLLGV